MAGTAKSVDNHPDLSHGWIEIFRAGDYSSQGKASITTDDLRRVVDSYDPAYHEAPICVGHPKSDGPAYGWIEKLALSGDTLLAKEKQVDPAFAELRSAGRFKKRSAAFYQDENGAIAGLRHVGWLGAQPPAVKGLRDAAFDDHEQNYIECEFGEEEAMAEQKTVREEIASFFSELLGGKKPEAAAFSEADVKRIVGEAVTSATEPLQTKITALGTELTAQKTQFAEMQSAAATGAKSQRAKDAVAQLKGKNRWLPAYEKMGLPALFDELAGSDTKVEFGEGDKKHTVTTLDGMVEFLEGLGEIVPAGRVFNGGNGSPASGKPTDDPLTSAAKARAAEKKIEFGEALAEVASEHPEMVQAPGTPYAGAV
ncbi:MAG: hypothetical protein P4K83_02135 [Terracidiphilus sp.]|nr:hypothetical protein [Terracidiphilus sp.]